MRSTGMCSQGEVTQQRRLLEVIRRLFHVFWLLKFCLSRAGVASETRLHDVEIPLFSRSGKRLFAPYIPHHESAIVPVLAVIYVHVTLRGSPFFLFHVTIKVVVL